TAGTAASRTPSGGYGGLPSTDYHGPERGPRAHPEPAAILRTDSHANAPGGNERGMVGDHDRTRTVAGLVRTGCTVRGSDLPDRTTDVWTAAEFPAGAEVECTAVGNRRPCRELRCHPVRSVGMTALGSGLQPEALPSGVVQIFPSRPAMLLGRVARLER